MAPGGSTQITPKSKPIKTSRYKHGEFVRYAANTFFLMTVQNVVLRHDGRSGFEAFYYQTVWLDSNGAFQTGEFLEDNLEYAGALCGEATG